MPYFIFSIEPGPSRIVSKIELLDQCEDFREAKQRVRAKRSALKVGSELSVRMVFARTQMEAEELLSSQREAPILQEWEK